jgi:hypothetical protein
LDGLDFGALLDKTLGAYQAVSVARLERDTARYGAAATTQQNALHRSEAMNATEAYATGNAVNPAAAKTGAVGSYFDRIPKPLFYGSVGLLGLALVLKAVK